MTTTDTRLPTTGGIDIGEVEALYRKLLVALGQDVDSEGLRDTPARVARFWRDFLQHDPGTTDTAFTHQESGGQYVVVSGIRAWSLCQHHLLPFRLDVHIGYVPAGRVLGLSKLPRIVQTYAHRLQLQEALTAQVAREVAALSGSGDVGVWSVGEHLCMAMRGVRDQAARTTAACLLGRLESDDRLAERLRTAAFLPLGAR
ncbi:GTP cyclohydrolase I FolE [Streptomyces sp. ID05-04B]|uniref:GTP cyclohydrolase I n=1 Tax=Streptomyces sp. ID05-04B TaxID=3028661 RepID=UPI0029C2BE78|nr:GTP cyclohydrolase I FolE [Streptomyces sp. ID05-04B]MDX5567473.1 GTP cyclohydrolase I FolE [Streptomyces sp. ID05-04B]